MTFWYKAANTLIDDTKLRIISAKLKISHCETVATFHSLLERCSKNNSDMFTTDMSALCEEINLQLGIEGAHLILKEFEQKAIIEGNKLLKWNDYQANTSTQRVKEWREKKKSETLRNVTETNVTQSRIEKTRIEKNTTTQLDEDLQIFNEILQITGGRILDPSPITKWLEAGADKQTILQVIKTRDKPQVRSLKYFDGMIADAIAYKNQPLSTQTKGKRNDRKTDAELIQAVMDATNQAGS